MTTEQQSALRTYIEENVEDFHLRFQVALHTIGHYRCNLSFAEPRLSDEIQETADEWLEDYNYCLDEDEQLTADEIADFLTNEYYL